MVICKEIIFLVHSLESGFGGMESHQNAFIRYFIVKQELPIICKYVVENKGNNYKYITIVPASGRVLYKEGIYEK